MKHYFFIMITCLTLMNQVFILLYDHAQMEEKHYIKGGIILSILMILILVYLKKESIIKFKQIFFKKAMRVILMIIIMNMIPYSKDLKSLSYKLQYFIAGQLVQKYAQPKQDNNLFSGFFLISVLIGIHISDIDLVVNQWMAIIVSITMHFIWYFIYFHFTYNSFQKRKLDEVNNFDYDNHNNNGRQVNGSQKEENNENEILSGKSLSDKLKKVTFQEFNQINEDDESVNKQNIELHIPKVNLEFESIFYKQIMQNYPEGMVILGMDLTIHFVNIALMKVLNESKSRLALIELLKLKNCQQEYYQQAKLHYTFSCLKSRLSYSRNLFNHNSDEEDDIEEDWNKFMLDYESFVSDSATVEQELEKIIQKMKQISTEDFDIEQNQMKFLYQVSMICSIDGNVNSPIQSYHSANTTKQGQLFQITQKPFIFNEVGYVLILLKDVTHFNQIKSLSNLNQNKSQMLQQVAHEFRTPLNCVILLVENLIPMVNLQIQNDYLIPIVASTKQLLSLINDLLDLAQLKAGKFKLNYNKFNFIQMVKDMSTFLSPNINAKGNKLVIEYEEDMNSEIISDINRIRQVLMNLISNSNKYTDEGLITIQIEWVNQSYLLFSVTDTGYGIEKEDQDKLFSAFGRLEKGKEMNIQGVGLGLMISNILAERLGEPLTFLNRQFSSSIQSKGLQVYSEGIHKGSTFSFIVYDQQDQFSSSSQLIDQKQAKNNYISVKSIQLRSQQKCDSCRQQQSSPENQEFGSSPSLFVAPKVRVSFSKPQVLNQPSEEQIMIGSSKTLNKQGIEQSVSFGKQDCICANILLVDDEIFNITALKLSLQKYKLKIDSATNGQMALDKIKNFKKDQQCTRDCSNYKIVLMDLEMPILNGFEATKQIREKYKDIYIIGQSGHNYDMSIKCKQIGMDDYITKPINVNDLFGKIQQIL